jgi:hypothetical protein
VGDGKLTAGSAPDTRYGVRHERTLSGGRGSDPAFTGADMGRGRAKAKQGRIARELKYCSPPTDLTALQRELAGKPRPDDHEPNTAHHTSERDGSSAR